MSEQEQRLAEYLKRAVPEPPVWLSPGEISGQRPERSRKSWAIPILAAAAVVAIGVTIGAVATHHPATRPPAASSVADQGSTGSAGTASAQATPTCQAGISVTVPNVIGMNVQQAEHVLAQAGFVSAEGDGGPGSPPLAAPSGTVITQSPAAGTRLPRGAPVALTTSATTASGGTPVETLLPPKCSASRSVAASGATVAVPSVIGMTRVQAEQILQAAGFTVIQLSRARAGQTVPAGEVWSQSVPGGAKAPRGTTITLDVVPN